MTLVSIKNELVKARQGCYAIPLFDVFDMHGMEGMMAAMAEKRAPTIIGVYTAWVDKPFSRALAAYLRCRAEETDIPMSLMLDHGASVELCLQALDFGFTDVMIDCSKQTFEENIANTKKVVAAAHARGASAYAAKAVGLAAPHDPAAAAREIGWQLDHASPGVRDVLRRLPPPIPTKAGLGVLLGDLHLRVTEG